MLNTQVLTQNKRVLIFVAVFALTAVIFLLAQILASADVAVFEAEQATPSSGATVQQDTNSSGGQYVAFANPGDPEPDPEHGDVLFFEDFVQPSSVDRFENLTFHRDFWFGNDGFEADHAPVADGTDPDNCTNPFSTRSIAPFETLVEVDQGHVYRCAPGDDPNKAHMMTAQGPQSGYDFTAFWTKKSWDNITELRWDQNVTDLGGRNWSEVKIVPVRTWNPLQPPCAISWAPCYTEAEGGSVGNTRSHADMESIGAVWFNVFPRVVSPIDETSDEWHYRTDVGKDSTRNAMENAYRAFTSPAPRFTHILKDNGNGTITLSLDTRTTEWAIHEIGTINGSFPNEPAIVVFAAHNYTSGKGESSYPGETWHWDNIVIK